ncbi:MAG: DUF1109 domain-containing protein [Rhodoferax sp.]|nr:DUF1109 domain-containing protein [Rhodoferax sp.]
MKTDELVHLLATGLTPAPRRAATRRLGAALAAGLALAWALLITGYGIRPDLAQAAVLPMFWVKLLVPALVGAAGLRAAHRLGRPGVPAGIGTLLGLVAPVGGLWLLAAAAWLTAPVPDRPALLWGNTWTTCALSIAALSMPTFAGALLALRSLAPTRPTAAGAAAGALAGGLGAAVYALHCPELAAPFLALWYGAGMAIPVLAGAWLGPRCLRW